MSSTFETVAGIISETCDIPREKITPASHAIDDLGIDSLAFLDIAFAVDKAFGIKFAQHHPRGEEIRRRMIDVSTAEAWRSILDEYYLT